MTRPRCRPPSPSSRASASPSSSDPGSKTIDAWALRDPQYAADSFAYGVPSPAIFVLDRTGVIRAKLAEDGYKVRPTVAAILDAAGGVMFSPF